MKKTKKFDDGGSTGGRFVDMGESRVFVPDTPAVVADRPDVVARPMGAGLAGQGAGMQEMPLVQNSDIGRPDVVARPMGLMVPRGRGIGAGLAGQAAMARMAGMKKGGTVKKMAKGGSTSSASKRGDGCAIKGKTKGRFV
jgi:hypothetical protein